MSGRLLVVKIGGTTLSSHDTTLKDLVTLQQDGMRVIIVHGGGNLVSQWMERQGSVPRFIRGLRVTDAQNLEIVVAVLTGLMNKQLVTTLIALGAKVVGLSGVDAGMLHARISDPEMGFVGEITDVDPAFLLQSLEAGYMPVVAPLGFHYNHSSPQPPIMLNINGDTVAGELALATGAQRLVFLTDVAGVMDGSGRVISRLPGRQARMLLGTGVVRGGMIPKVQACLRALERAVETHIIDGRRPGALLECISGKAVGTRIEG